MEKLRIPLVTLIVLFAGLALAGPLHFVSEYSSLSDSDCKTIDSGIDSGVERCPSHDGYSVHIYGGEGASSLAIKKNEKKEFSFDPEKVGGLKLPTFSRPYIAGEDLEWRYDISSGKKRLTALVYRIGDQSWPDNQNYLFVIRATGESFCPLGLVKTNEEAQKLTDSGKACER